MAFLLFLNLLPYSDAIAVGEMLVNNLDIAGLAGPAGGLTGGTPGRVASGSRERYLFGCSGLGRIYCDQRRGRLVG